MLTNFSPLRGENCLKVFSNSAMNKFQIKLLKKMLKKIAASRRKLLNKIAKNNVFLMNFPVVFKEFANFRRFAPKITKKMLKMFGALRRKLLKKIANKKFHQNC